MHEVDRLMAEYKEAFREGAADVRPFLERAAPADRALLAALIDAFLEAAPRREVPGQDSAAEAVTDQVERALSGASGLWPALLPRLRSRARLRRSEVVAQLAARLGAQGQQDKVGLYYHQMEQGLLPERGVSDAVLEALGRIVGYTAEGLRKAGSLPAPGPPRADEGAVFARTVRGAAAAPAPGPAQPDEWDEVDHLFRGAP